MKNVTRHQKPKELPGQLARADEAELIHRLRKRELAAERKFYDCYRRMVAANIYRVLGSQNELEDLVQEVFVIAFCGIDRFRGESRLSTWLYRIAVNVALGHIRSRSRRPLPILLDESMHRTQPSPELGPAQILAKKEDRKLCYKLLDGLSSKKRIVLYLHEFEGRTLAEIAALIGVHPVTVRTRLYYARREFFRVAERALAESSAKARAGGEEQR